MDDLFKKPFEKLDNFALVNEAEAIADLINTSYFRGKLRVIELEIYDDLEILRRFIIEGTIPRKDKDLLEKIKSDIIDICIKFNGKEKGLSLINSIWSVKVDVITVGEKFIELKDLINVKGYKETLAPFENEICMYEFWDCTHAIKLGNAVILRNACTEFKKKQYNDKRIINYIGIANYDNYNNWMEIMKRWDIKPDGQNVFQFTKEGLAEELELELPYLVIVDQNGIVRQHGPSTSLDYHKILLNLYKNPPEKEDKSDLKKLDTLFDLEKKYSFDDYDGLANHRMSGERLDDNPRFSFLDTESRISCVNDTNQNLISLGLDKVKLKVLRNVFYDYKDTHYLTKAIFAGFVENDDQTAILYSLVESVKDMYQLDKVEYKITNTAGVDPNITRLIEALAGRGNSLLG